ncbi:MAG: hypothetical protein ACYCPT_10580, partial [Acidimicrobiales bacterium]
MAPTTSGYGGVWIDGTNYGLGGGNNSVSTTTQGDRVFTIVGINSGNTWGQIMQIRHGQYPAQGSSWAMDLDANYLYTNPGQPAYQVPLWVFNPWGNGNNVLCMSPTNVGINVTNPNTNFALDVSGSANVSSMYINNTSSFGISPAYALNIIGTINGSLNQLIAFGAGSTSYFVFVLDSSFNFQILRQGITTAPFVILTSNGYVGINQNNPQYQLDITGSLNTTGDIFCSGFTNTGTTTTVNQNIGSTLTLGNTTYTTPAITTGQTNTITPATYAPLLIQTGNGTSGGQITIDASTPTTAIAGALTVSTTADITTSVTTGEVITSEITTSSGDLTIAPVGASTAITGALSVSNGASITGALTVSTTADITTSVTTGEVITSEITTSSGDLTIAPVGASTAITGALSVSNGASITGALTVSTTADITTSVTTGEIITPLITTSGSTVPLVLETANSTSGGQITIYASTPTTTIAGALTVSTTADITTSVTTGEVITSEITTSSGDLTIAPVGASTTITGALSVSNGASITGALTVSTTADITTSVTTGEIITPEITTNSATTNLLISTGNGINGAQLILDAENVSAPTILPTITTTSGSLSIGYYWWIYTYQTVSGEETTPSPPSNYVDATAKIQATITFTISTNNVVSQTNIYRGASSTTTMPSINSFQLVGYAPMSENTFVDNNTDPKNINPPTSNNTTTYTVSNSNNLVLNSTLTDSIITTGSISTNLSLETGNGSNGAHINVYAGGIDNPTVSPQVPSAGPGNIPTGSYYYVYTWLSISNEETSISPYYYTGPITGGSLAVVIPNTNIQRVAYANVYRATTNSISSYQLVGTTTPGSTFMDNIAVPQNINPPSINQTTNYIEADANTLFINSTHNNSIITTDNNSTNLVLQTSNTNGGHIFIDASTNNVNIGYVIPDPTGALISSTPISGNVSGTFNWAYTFVNSMQQETLMSPVSATQTGANVAFPLSGISTGNSFVIKRNIYRSATGPTTPYQLVGILFDNTTTTFTDNNNNPATVNPPSINNTNETLTTYEIIASDLSSTSGNITIAPASAITAITGSLSVSTTADITTSITTAEVITPSIISATGDTLIITPGNNQLAINSTTANSSTMWLNNIDGLWLDGTSYAVAGGFGGGTSTAQTDRPVLMSGHSDQSFARILQFRAASGLNGDGTAVANEQQNSINMDFVTSNYYTISSIIRYPLTFTYWNAENPLTITPYGISLNNTFPPTGFDIYSSGTSQLGTVTITGVLTAQSAANITGDITCTGLTVNGTATTAANQFVGALLSLGNTTNTAPYITTGQTNSTTPATYAPLLIETGSGTSGAQIKLDATSPTTAITGALSISNGASITGALSVSTTADITTSVTTGELITSEITTSSGDLTIAPVGASTTITGALSISNGASITGALSVSTTADITTSVTTGELITSEITTSSGDLTIAPVGASTAITGALTVSSSITTSEITTDSITQNLLLETGNKTGGGQITIDAANPTTAITGALAVSNGATITGALDVSGGTTLAAITATSVTTPLVTNTNSSGLTLNGGTNGASLILDNSNTTIILNDVLVVNTQIQVNSIIPNQPTNLVISSGSSLTFDYNDSNCTFDGNLIVQGTTTLAATTATTLNTTTSLITPEITTDSTTTNLLLETGNTTAGAQIILEADVVVANPTTAASVVYTTPGNIASGSYWWIYNYQTASGEQTAPSPNMSSTTTQSSPFYATITVVSTTSPYIVQINIYRGSGSTVPATSAFQYVGSIAPSGTSFVDNIANPFNSHPSTTNNISTYIDINANNVIINTTNATAVISSGSTTNNLVLTTGSTTADLVIVPQSGLAIFAPLGTDGYGSNLWFAPSTTMVGGAGGWWTDGSNFQSGIYPSGITASTTTTYSDHIVTLTGHPSYGYSQTLQLRHNKYLQQNQSWNFDLYDGGNGTSAGTLVYPNPAFTSVNVPQFVFNVWGSSVNPLVLTPTGVGIGQGTPNTAYSLDIGVNSSGPNTSSLLCEGAAQFNSTITTTGVFATPQININGGEYGSPYYPLNITANTLGTGNLQQTIALINSSNAAIWSLDMAPTTYDFHFDRWAKGSYLTILAANGNVGLGLNTSPAYALDELISAI